MTEDQETHMLTGAYALGAVDELEAARVRDLLRTSSEAAAEVRSFTETAARLGVAEAVEPPAGMRAAVMTQIAQTRQAAPVAGPAPRTTTRLLRLVSVAAAVLLVLAVGVGVTAASLRERLTQAQHANQAMTEVLADPGRQVMGADLAGGHAVIVAAGDRVVVLGTHVPAPPDGKEYQLWMIPGGENAKPIPSVTLTPTGDGGFWADTGGYDGEALAVTVEPVGGSKAPTSAPLFVATA